MALQVAQHRPEPSLDDIPEQKSGKGLQGGSSTPNVRRCYAVGCPVCGGVIGDFTFLCRFHKAVDSSLWTEVTATLNRYKVFIVLIAAVDAGTIGMIGWNKRWSRWIADLVQKTAKELSEEEILTLLPRPYTSRLGETFPLEAPNIWARRCEAYIESKTLTEERIRRSRIAKNQIVADDGLSPAEHVLCELIKKIRLEAKGDVYR